MIPQKKRRGVAAAARIVALSGALGVAASAVAGDLRPPRGSNAAWSSECGSCHVAYPPRLLPASSWRAIVQGLDRHFGTDASVDPKAAASIGAFLEANAGRERAGIAGTPLLRITETRWFSHEHSGQAAAVWKRGQIKSPADCAACHRQAAAGDYGERTLRLPQ